MKRASNKILAGLSITLMGFGFPAILVYLAAFYAFNIWFVGIFTFLSLLGAAVVTFIIFIFADSDIWDDNEDLEERHNELVRTMASLIQRLERVQVDLKEIDETLRMEE